MKIAIMQPYLFPYRGYFDLIATVDKFVIYDDVQYKKGWWINRNYFPELFTFRLKKHSTYAKINECYFSNVEDDRKRFRNKFNFKKDYLDQLKQDLNLADNITITLRLICDDLNIQTPILLSSSIPHGRHTQGLIDIITALGGDTYVNLPGGKKIYTQEMFGNIKLEFIETQPGPSILCSL
ncbi:MAG: WbqC family protein [Patescibacteria group bacterium]